MAKELQQINHLKNNMYVFPSSAKQIMTLKEVRETLLATDNFIMACGYRWKLKIKNIGAGMKEVSLIKFEE